MSRKSLAQWLTLREGPDSAARSPALTRAIAERLVTASPIQVLDLGAGRGSNLRYLAPHLQDQQRWLLVDQDAALLEEARTHFPEGRPVSWHVDTRAMNLVSLDQAEIFSGRHLVTASALLDLVSPGWLEVLALRCRDVGALALFTLIYNGRSSCTPAEPEDDDIRELLNRHQRSDKGLGGIAAGPDAVACAERSFAAAGYHVRREISDWMLGPEHPEMQTELIRGWADVAVELEPDRRRSIEDWLGRRLRHVEAGRSHIVVGHDDLAAWLP